MDGLEQERQPSKQQSTSKHVAFQLFQVKKVRLFTIPLSRKYLDIALFSDVVWWWWVIFILAVEML